MTRHILSTAIIVLAPSVCAAQVADSAIDFSDTQGAGGWFYGIYNQGATGGQPHGYTPQDFVEFDQFDVGSQRWISSDGQVGPQNNDFLHLDALGGHPTGLGPELQDSIIWAVRRYLVPSSGLARIEVDLRKENIANPRGGGITGRIFVDGLEILTQLIENADGVGVSPVLVAPVSAGSTIDFAIDPTGITPIEGSDGVFSARADGSVFDARIAIVPEPGGCLLLFAALIATLSSRRRVA